MMLTNEQKSFIEVQFPVSKVSKESYKERKAGSNQTLTGLGKWWGRKPLILVRASLLGLLMPSSDDPIKDRDIFLKILTMDNEGLVQRKNKSIPTIEIYNNLTPTERKKYFVFDIEKKTIKYKKGMKAEEKESLQYLVFNRLSYDTKLEYCLRPEELDNLSEKQWTEINQHLGTNATSLWELIRELGIKKFGYVPTVGDCFCGGGSIPFEAGRMGCNVYASDLNPLAGLLTWADLNILNKSDKEINKLKKFQENVYDAVAKQVEEWRIENNENGWKAKFYLYCNEVVCPECGCKVPLSPNWVVSEGYNVIAQLKFNERSYNFDIIIKSGVSKEEIIEAEKNATIKYNSLYCPHCKQSTPITSIRKDRKNDDGSVEYGLRRWNISEYLPQEDDIFKERLYCIKYIEKSDDKTWEELMKKPAPATDACYGDVHYNAPSEEDLIREEKVINLLNERFKEWQEKGYIPNSEILSGDKTEEPIRNRGWAYWHQLFNPRQLLINGLFCKCIDELSTTEYEKVFGLLGFNKCVDRMSKLSMWHFSYDKSEATFSNQALNTLFVYATRTMSTLYNPWILRVINKKVNIENTVKLTDARNIDKTCPIWITDPPYADAVNYHELSEYFLAWDKKLLSDTFPNWYSDSKRALAVKGTGKDFNSSMIEIYRNLREHMPDNGMQIVMFTHQDVKVWAELTMILWSAGLRVVSAWNVATETESGGLKEGNYVKGTVLLVLKKQTSDETAFQDDLYPEIKAEVKRMIDSMKALDEGEETNFSDADYLLASYASSLKVLTAYKKIEGIDIQYELSKPMDSKEISPVEEIINKAVKIAYDYLIPIGFNQQRWKLLSPEERLYIKGLELEKNGTYQLGAYQELARGYGVSDYKDMFQSTKANNVRFKTPMEFKTSSMQNDRFNSTLTRNVLMALYQSVKGEDTKEGKNWLRAQYGTVVYWENKNMFIEILEYLSKLEAVEHMEHWRESAKYANMLKEVVKNDSI